MSASKVGQIWETTLDDGSTRRAVVEEVLDGVGSALIRYLDDSSTATVAAAELGALQDANWRLVSDPLSISAGDSPQPHAFGQITSA